MRTTAARRSPWRTRLLLGALSLSLMNSPLSAATSVLGTGMQRAEVGAVCHTRPDSLFAVNASDLQRADELLAAKDTEGWNRLLTRDAITLMKPDLMVHVEARRGRYIQVRPHGMSVQVWMAAWDVDCPAIPARTARPAR